MVDRRSRQASLGSTWPDTLYHQQGNAVLYYEMRHLSALPLLRHPPKAATALEPTAADQLKNNRFERTPKLETGTTANTTRSPTRATHAFVPIASQTPDARPAKSQWYKANSR